MAPHSSTLAWKIPWMEGPGRLQSMGSLRVGHDWATSLSLFTFHFYALGKEMATHSSVLAWRIPGTGKPGVLQYMGSQSRTQLNDWTATIFVCFSNILLHDMMPINLTIPVPLFCLNFNYLGFITSMMPKARHNSPGVSQLLFPLSCVQHYILLHNTWSIYFHCVPIFHQHKYSLLRNILLIILT